MKKRNIIITVLIVLLLIIGLTAYDQYKQLTNIKELKITLNNVQITNIKLTQLTAEFNVNIHNPNNKDVKVNKIHAELYTNNMMLTQVDLQQTTIKKQQTIQTTIPVTINYLDAGIALLNAIKEKQAKWSIKGTYELELPFGIKYEYDFEHSKNT